MNSRFLVLAALVTAFVGLATEAQAKPHFTYRVETIVGQHGEANCSDRAKQMGDQFSSYGIAVESAKCTGTRTVNEEKGSYQLSTIIISYYADRPVYPYLAIYGGREFQGQTSAGVGTLTTLGDCAALAQTQIPVFEAETKLKFLAVECVASDVGGPSFSLQISALGKPARQLYMYDQGTEVYGVNARPELLAATQNILKISGADVTTTIDGHIFYYFTRFVPINNPQLGNFNTLQQCEVQKATALSILTQAHLVAPQAFCSGGVDGQAVLLDGIGGDVIVLNSDMGYNSLNYATFEDCFNDIARVTENTTSTGAKVLGVLCRKKLGSNSVFVTEMYKPSLY